MKDVVILIKSFFMFILRGSLYDENLCQRVLHMVGVKIKRG